MPGVTIVRSTADLTPDGIAGYAKTIAGFAGFLGTVLAVVQPMVAPDSPWGRWLGIAIAVLGVIATYALPNKVEPVAVNRDPLPPVPPGDLV